MLLCTYPYVKSIYTVISVCVRNIVHILLYPNSYVKRITLFRVVIFEISSFKYKTQPFDFARLQIVQKQGFIK